jgi:hypothetical protein
MHDAKNAQSALAQQIAQTIADEIGAQSAQVRAAVGLLDEGASVPFIARYRKEVTGGLDDTQLRNLEVRLTYLRELEDRRAAVLASIGEQGKLSDELRNDILAADTKSRLEDLYLPYKPKRRTRAQIAREAGLEPLADGLLADPTQDPQVFAATFVDTDKGVADTKAALEGARAILMERWGEDAALVGELRTWLGETGVIRARVAEGKETEGAKYRDYFEHAESLAKIPRTGCWRCSARAARRSCSWNWTRAAMPRPATSTPKARGAQGRHRRPGPCRRPLAAGCLPPDLARQAAHPSAAGPVQPGPRKGRGRSHRGVRRQPEGPAAGRTGRPEDRAGPGPGHPHRLQDRRGRCHRQAGRHRHHLPARAAPPVGAVAADDQAAVRQAQRGTDRDRQRHRQPRNRQAGRRSDQGCRQPEAAEGRGQRGRRLGVFGLRVRRQGVPGLDVSLRGAVSIARRLQDPLAELVKIEPKAIGVGQYQHDVDQYRLARALDARRGLRERRGRT